MESSALDSNMQERIEKFNQFLLSQDIERIPLGLFSGKMGMCIYFYHQARQTNDKAYEKFAKKLLDFIYTQLHAEFPIDIENGLAGICIGINYLIENKFITGNPNYVLKELDDKIFQHFNFIQLSGHIGNSDSLIKLLDIAHYFSIRLSHPKLSANERFLFNAIVIKAINQIDANASVIEKFPEPLLFTIRDYYLPYYLYLLAKVYELNIYNYKIDKILEGLTDQLNSTYPLLLSNRYLLSTAMRKVSKVVKTVQWQEHIELLEQKTSATSIINDEFRNKNIFPNDGVSGFYFLLKDSDILNKNDKKAIAKKIAQSEAWDKILNDPTEIKYKMGLVNGFAGVILVYQDIQQSFQDTEKKVVLEI